MKKFEWIPTISHERLVSLSAQIMPLRLKDDGALEGIVACNLHDSYLWSPVGAIAPPPEIAEVFRLDTLHTFAYHGFFKPSIEEVMAQIQHLPFIDQIVAFRLAGPEDADDLNKQLWAFDSGFHRAACILYSNKEQGSDGWTTRYKHSWNRDNQRFNPN